MKVITPIEVNDTVLSSSTIPEPDASKGEIEWVAGAYTTDTERIKSTTHLRYRVVASPSTTDDPEVGVNASPPTWSVVGSTNRFAMFDNKNSTQSETDSTLVVDLVPTTLVNSLAGFNITGATSINVKINDGTSDVYDKDITMVDNSARINAYEYFFSPKILINRFVLTDLPPTILDSITITAETADTVGFGNLVAGSLISLGDTAMNTELQGLDFSVRAADGFGGFDVTKRGTADLFDYNFVTQTSRLSYLKNNFKRLSQVPTVWIGKESDVNDAYTIFGYYNDYRIKDDNPSILRTTLQVQELI